MGVSARTVQRSLSWLAKNGFLAKAPKAHRNDRQRYDLEPLVEKLKPFAMARIRLMQEKDFSNVLSDAELNMMDRPSGSEMFSGVVRKLADEL